METCQPTVPDAIGGARQVGAPFLPQAGWTPESARRRAALLVLALHGVLVAMLWQTGRVAVRKLESPALSVSLLPAQSAKPVPTEPRQPVISPVLPALAVSVVPTPEFASQTAPREITPTPPANPAKPETEPTVVRNPSLNPPTAPKPVAEGSLRYRVEPAVEVPRLSRRAGEYGSVVLRVVFDVHGSPRDIQIQRSSGHARLDAQALEAMQAARIEPYLERGHPIDIVASATLEYELN